MSNQHNGDEDEMSALLDLINQVDPKRKLANDKAQKN
jgi:hypothetical protein